MPANKVTLEQVLVGGFFWDFGQVPEDAHRQVRSLVRSGEWVKVSLPWYGTGWHKWLYHRKDLTRETMNLP